MPATIYGVSEYDRAGPPQPSWPPTRFRQLLDGDTVVCLSRNCALPVILDLGVFTATRTAVAEWIKRNTEPVPPRLLRLASHCLNGHTEVTHAEPVSTPEAAAVQVEAEEQRHRGLLTTKTCTSCEDEYKGTKYSRYCGSCKTSQ